MEIPPHLVEPCAKLAKLIARSAPRRRIVALLVQGKSRKEIAAVLQRSPHTIDSQIKSMYAALGISDRAQLILVAQLVRLFGVRSTPPELGTGAIQNLSENS